MFSHSDIWRGIDRLADSFGYSPSGLAKKAGLDSTSFNKSKRTTAEGKPRWPSTESIAKILQVTGATMSDFIALIDATSEAAGADQHEGQIPVIGFAQAGKSGFFDEDGYPSGDGWDMVSFPDHKRTRSEHIFGLKINGNSMKPLYRKDDTIILSLDAQIRTGDRVVVKTRDGEVMAKEVIKKNSDSVKLMSLNPSYDDVHMKTCDIAWMARILWVSQ